MQAKKPTGLLPIWLLFSPVTLPPVPQLQIWTKNDENLDTAVPTLINRDKRFEAQLEAEITLNMTNNDHFCNSHDHVSQLKTNDNYTIWKTVPDPQEAISGGKSGAREDDGSAAMALL
uniref:Secreted protein n=1 Tax=Mesocestoides corti TaxID=53468 RepID=A0A5K3EGJ0_MESCO